MNCNPFKVLIVGAGAGGLCLAQGLKRDGIDVQVFERDPSPAQTRPGYRLSISPTGARALKACLPDALFEEFLQNTAQPSEAVSFLDHRLKRLLEIDLPRHDRRSLDAERPIGRTSLRRILLEGLDEIVHFGKKFVGYEIAPSGEAAARFEDGSIAVGDVLVGADGANSRVRSILLPEAKREDTGLVGIGGKLALSDEVRAWIPRAIMKGPTPILGPPGCFLFASPVQFGDLGESGAGVDRTLGDERHSVFDDRDAYVMWGFSTRGDRFRLGGEQGSHSGEQLKSAVEGLMGDWHAKLRRLVEQTDPSTVKTFSVKTSVPVAPWNTCNVTLLGDALHNMPPYRGVGANAALWDAAALRQALAAAGRGEVELLKSLADYERAMIDHGFQAVRGSLRDMARFHSERWLDRTLTRGFLRAVDAVPALQRVFAPRR
jgi:2-polyprenyl-6-methoxyphenol hydroxylase-like FAD-dependent oxidoreductase